MTYTAWKAKLLARLARAGLRVPASERKMTARYIRGETPGQALQGLLIELGNEALSAARRSEAYRRNRGHR